MKRAKKKSAGAPTRKGRKAARKAGKRQYPFPHEHKLMLAQPTDPDNDGDTDTPGQADND